MTTRPTGKVRRRTARWGVRGFGMLIGLSGLLLVGLAVNLGWNGVQERASTDLVRALFTALLATYPLWIGSEALRGFSSRLNKHVCLVAALFLGGTLYSPLQSAGAYLPIESNFLEDIVVISAGWTVILVVYAMLRRGIQSLTGCSGRNAEKHGASNS